MGGLKDVVQGAKTWREALLGVAQSFGKIAEQQLVDKPLSKAIDTWFSGSDTGDTAGKGDFGKIGELLSGGWSWLEGQLGFGSTPAGQGQTTAQLATGAGASGGSSLRGLGAAAGALSQSAQQLGQAGAAGQLGSAGKALGAMPGIFQSVLGSMVGTMTVNAALVNVSGGAGGGSAGGGVLGQIGGWFSGLFGSGGYGTTGDEGPGGSAASASTMTSGGTNPGFLLGGAAYGAVFEGGNVIPFARGGVVDRPTLFPMARGMGLMGEAGPEAVLPLRRLPSGRLGVETPGSSPGGGGSTGQARGGGGHTVSVNVVVNGGDQATADASAASSAGGARRAAGGGRAQAAVRLRASTRCSFRRTSLMAPPAGRPMRRRWSRLAAASRSTCFSRASRPQLSR